MKREHTEAERRELAQKLRSIYEILERCDPESLGLSETQLEDILFDLDDAVFALSPAFVREENAALDADLNSPEMDAFMEELKKDPAYQKGLEEFKELTRKVTPIRKPKDGDKRK